MAHKHLITMQRGISTNQMRQMGEAGLTLVVPESLQKTYPKERPMEMLSVDEFMRVIVEACM